MPNTLQDFLADAAEKASASLVTAFLSLPADRRAWEPTDTARSALDQVVECALLNGTSADLIVTRRPNDDYPYHRLHAEAQARGWEYVRALLAENTQRVAAVIRDVPDDALDAEVALPWNLAYHWERQTLTQVLAFPYWNMMYHQAQINYIASLLGRWTDRNEPVE